MRRPTVLPVVLLAAAGLVGCSGEDAPPAAAPTRTTSPATTTTTAAAPAPAVAPTVDEEDDEEPAADPTGAAEAAPTSRSTATPVSEDDARGVRRIFAGLVREHCTNEDGRHRSGPMPDPAKAEVVLKRRGPRWVLEDANHDRLVLDTAAGTVHDERGPKAELPAAYSFGCDPEVFIGTSH